MRNLVTRMTISRRTFLSRLLAAVALMPGLRAARTMGQGAPEASARPPGAADTLRAMAARIIPPDKTAGASDADILPAIEEHVAASPKLQQMYAAGLAELTAESGRRFGDAFAKLGAAEQDELLKAIETTPFFRSVRGLAVTAFYNSPVGQRGVGFPGEGQPMGHRDFDRRPTTGVRAAADLPALPQDEGRDDLAARCMQCHDASAVIAKRRSPAEWRTEVERMMSQYHVPLAPGEADRIVGYLGRNFGVK